VTTAALDAPAGTTATGPTLRSTARRVRGPVAVAVVLVVVAAVAGLLAVRETGLLDPAAFDPAGSRAVAELLRDGGVEVERVGTVEEVLAAGGSDAVVVVPRPEVLAREELERLGEVDGRLLVVSPDEAALEALGLPATVAGDVDVDGRRPACDFPPAQRAGDADVGGLTYAPTEGGATGCYAAGGAATLLVLPDADAIVLGTGAPLTNGRLDERGNAALALGLLGSGERVVWLVADPSREVPVSAQRPLLDLVPDWLKLGVVQLGVAVVVLALWRGRRLGRVVEEPLPVVVRAAESVEGRARLYRAAKARGSAAEALRSGVRNRAARVMGLPPSADRSAVVATAAQRSGRDAAAVDAVLYGAAPSDDAALVRLADALRELERALTAAPAPRPRPPSSEEKPGS
jgi:hypothetical protein